MVASQIYCHQCGQGLPQHARFCAGCGTPVVSSTQAAHVSHQPQPRSGPRFKLPVKLVKGAAWGVAGLFVLVMFIAMLSGGGSTPPNEIPGTYTVKDYIQDERQKLEQQLNTKPNDFGKHIENIHVTVTYKGGHVKSMTAKTVDGSNIAGPNGSNISEVDVVITAYWDGYLQKNGFTEMELLYDARGDTLKSVKYLDSNAVFNLTTVDWFKVGFTIGAWLAM